MSFERRAGKNGRGRQPQIVNTYLVNYILTPKRPYLWPSSTDQHVFPAGADSGGAIEVLAFFWIVLGQSGA